MFCSGLARHALHQVVQGAHHHHGSIPHLPADVAEVAARHGTHPRRFLHEPHEGCVGIGRREPASQCLRIQLEARGGMQHHCGEDATHHGRGMRYEAQAVTTTALGIHEPRDLRPVLMSQYLVGTEILGPERMMGTLTGRRAGA